MEEAERLADRVAVFDGGRIVALDTPAGIVSMVDPEQRLASVRRAHRGWAAHRSAEGPRVEHSGPSWSCTGTGNLIAAVTSVLARHQIVANDLRIEQASSTTRSSPSRAAWPPAPRRSCHERDASPDRDRGQAAVPDPVTWLAAIALPTVIL
jgi:ABC-type multidrug transport system ATPase subunit